MWSLFPLVKQYLPGVTCSGLHEAMLGHEQFGGEVHVYAPAFTDDEFLQILDLADHVSFNSFAQWQRFREVLAQHSQPPSPGLRINPQHREVEVELYDPCAPRSRLGVTVEQFEGQDLAGIEGLHFHTLCELNSDALERTLKAVEAQFGRFIPGMKWMNFGGGHHVTRSDYDLDRLIRVITGFQQRYPGVQIYLEPGEAVALNTGVLLASVLDIVRNEMDIAILDVSATCHMPDVLEMPYRPQIEAAGMPGEKAYTYRLGGLSCLAGDVIGDYSFDEPLRPGSRLVFGDMAHYSMVKTTTFNGVRHPSIAVHDSRTGTTRVVRRFEYEDYRDRLS